MIFYAAHNANKFALFTLAHSDSFEAALQALDKIDLPAAGSLEDALQFFDADIALWRDTDGALDWVRETVTRLRLSPPTRAEAASTGIAPSSSSVDRLLLAPNAPSSSRESIKSSSNSSSSSNGSGVEVRTGERESESVDTHAMFMGMYFTALEMAQE